MEMDEYPYTVDACYVCFCLYIVPSFILFYCELHQIHEVDRGSSRGSSVNLCGIWMIAFGDLRRLNGEKHKLMKQNKNRLGCILLKLKGRKGYK